MTRVACFFALVIGGCLALGGILTMSNATMGPTFMGAACFFGIVGRIFQASVYNKENKTPIAAAPVTIDPAWVPPPSAPLPPGLKRGLLAIGALVVIAAVIIAGLFAWDDFQVAQRKAAHDASAPK